MEKINWSDGYSVGVDSLNEQHKLIVGEINKLIEISDGSRNETERESIIMTLISYGRKHLSDEEDLLIDYEYPDYEEHADKHNYYRGVFYSILAKPNKPLTEIIEFLHSWWNNHILEEDMKYKTFFINKL